MMKLKKKTICSILLLLGVCIFSACGKEEVIFEKTILDDLSWYEKLDVQTLPLFEREEDEGSHWIYPWNGFHTDKGEIRFSKEKLVLEYCDWLTNKVYPLCVKPNCFHNDSSCNAYFSFEKGEPACLYYDGQFLYYEYSTKEDQTEWYRQNLDGSDRMKIFSVNEDFERSWVVYDKDVVYFVTNVYEVGEENINNGEQEVNIYYHIYSGNLKTGETKHLECEFSGEGIWLQLLGKYEEQLVISYNASTSLEPIDAQSKIFLYNLSEDTITGILKQDSILNIASCPDAISDGIYAFLELDIKKETIVDDHAYYEGWLNVVDLKNGCRYVLEKQSGFDYIIQYLDGKLFYSIGEQENIILESYDIFSGERKVIPVETANLIIDGEVDKWFYGRIISEDDMFISFHILKSDYYSGKRNLILEENR